MSLKLEIVSGPVQIIRKKGPLGNKWLRSSGLVPVENLRHWGTSQVILYPNLFATKMFGLGIS